MGTFAGTFQQNLSHPSKSEIDRLFHEIEKDIRKFSNENPMTEENANEIKNPKASSDLVGRKRRDVDSVEEAESKYTLSVWTDLWVGLISNYVRCLWITFKKDLKTENKQKAIQNAEQQYEKEKNTFKQKLNGKELKIESIYQKMKDFVLKIEFPPMYEYDNIGADYCPYENYVRKIV